MIPSFHLSQFCSLGAQTELINISDFCPLFMPSFLSSLSDPLLTYHLKSHTPEKQLAKLQEGHAF